MLLAPRIVVMGDSPVAAALVALAEAMAYRTLVACAEAERSSMPGADLYVGGGDLAGTPLTGTDAIIVATQGRGDHTALKSALTSGAGHIAFVGSRKKAVALQAELQSDGLSETDAARFKAPAGLDIGAIEPEEIALSIFAEVISWRRGRMPNVSETR